MAHLEGAFMNAHQQIGAGTPSGRLLALIAVVLMVSNSPLAADRIDFPPGGLWFWCDQAAVIAEGTVVMEKESAPAPAGVLNVSFKVSAILKGPQSLLGDTGSVQVDHISAQRPGIDGAKKVLVFLDLDKDDKLKIHTRTSMVAIDDTGPAALAAVRKYIALDTKDRLEFMINQLSEVKHRDFQASAALVLDTMIYGQSHASLSKEQEKKIAESATQTPSSVIAMRLGRVLHQINSSATDKACIHAIFGAKEDRSFDGFMGLTDVIASRHSLSDKIIEKLFQEKDQRLIQGVIRAAYKVPDDRLLPKLRELVKANPVSKQYVLPILTSPGSTTEARQVLARELKNK